MRIWLVVLVSLLLGSSAQAQIVFQGSSIQTSVSANTPTCSDNGGAPGVPSASASCSGPIGYGAASDASASFMLTSEGGILSLTANASASTPGNTPVEQSNATAIGNGLASWFLGSDTHYTITVDGDVTFDFSGTAGSGLPDSGTVSMGNYGLSGSATVSAVASDAGPLTAAASSSGAIEITLVPVGASDLIMGTVLAGGSPRAGLLVEAFDGATPVASTTTASDGRYLLPGIGVPVTLRSSDPAGGFATDVSPLLTAPATYDADLVPIAVPALGLPAAAALALMLAFTGCRTRARSAE